MEVENNATAKQFTLFMENRKIRETKVINERMNMTTDERFIRLVQ